MEPDEIREIRAMEARIAAEVMGWTCLKSPTDPRWPSLSWKGKCREGTSTEYIVPCYTQQIAEAWRIVKRLEGEGLSWDLQRYQNSPTCCICRFGNAEDTVRAEAETPELAICLAALAWVEERETPMADWRRALDETVRRQVEILERCRREQEERERARREVLCPCCRGTGRRRGYGNLQYKS